jgi:hypothetical protein
MKFTSFHSKSLAGRGNLIPSVSSFAEVDRARDRTIMISITRIADIQSEVSDQLTPIRIYLGYLPVIFGYFRFLTLLT